MTNSYALWKDWKDADFGRFGAEQAVYYERELEAAGVPAVRGLLVAELGFGNGPFAGWVRAAGGRWIGREAMPELQARARHAGYEVIEAEGAFSGSCGAESVDLIVAFDVLEHLDLDAIRSFLQDAGEALKPAGLVVLRFPSGDSPFAGAVYTGDTTHRTLLGSSAVRQLALEAGLEVRQIRSPCLPLRGLGFIRGVRRAAASLLQGMAFTFVRNVLMGNRGAVLSPNMIAVLCKPPRSTRPRR